jgi:chromosome segregation ATPase
MTEPPMNDSKLDQALNALARVEARLEIDFGALKHDIAEVKQGVSGVKEDLSGVKEDLSGVKEDLSGVKQDLSGVKQDLSGVKQDLSGVKQDLSGVKQDLSGVKQDLSGVKQDLSGVKARQEEMIAAFRAHWADTSNLYRTVREDLKRLEVWVEGRFIQLNQGLAALKESIEHQDYRHDELGRRITRLEMGEKPPY